MFLLHHHHTSFFIVLTILMALTRAQNFTNCNRHCGGKTLNYPFGFSEGCEVKLNCTKDQVKVDGFLVQNITPSTIFINLPAKCNRIMGSIKPLFNDNFAPTKNNSFLVQNCTEEQGGCVIPGPTFAGGQAEVESCDSRSGNISCFTPQRQKQRNNVVVGDVLSYDELKNTGCKFLFSSVALGQSKELLFLQFQVVELGWWIQGSCHDSGCSQNATCTEVMNPQGKNSSGFRCQCLQGFQGDGFINGTDCRRVPLKTICPGKNSYQDLHGIGSEDEARENDKSDKILFYFVIAVGFATGFWGIIGVLYFKKNWRYACFGYVDEVADRIYVAIVLKVAKLKNRLQRKCLDG